MWIQNQCGALVNLEMVDEISKLPPVKGDTSGEAQVAAYTTSAKRCRVLFTGTDADANLFLEWAAGALWLNGGGGRENGALLFSTFEEWLREQKSAE